MRGEPLGPHGFAVMSCSRYTVHADSDERRMGGTTLDAHRSCVNAILGASKYVPYDGRVSCARSAFSVIRSSTRVAVS